MYGEFRIDRAGLMWSHKNLFGLRFLTKKNSTGGTGVQQEIESYYCIFTSALCFTLIIAFVSHFLTALLFFSDIFFSQNGLYFADVPL